MTSTSMITSSSSSTSASPAIPRELSTHLKCCTKQCEEKYGKISDTAQVAVLQSVCHDILFRSFVAISSNNSKGAFLKGISQIPLNIAALKLDRFITGVFHPECIPQGVMSKDSVSSFLEQLLNEARCSYSLVEKGEQKNASDIMWHFKALLKVKLVAGSILEITTN